MLLAFYTCLVLPSFYRVNTNEFHIPSVWFIRHYGSVPTLTVSQPFIIPSIEELLPAYAQTFYCPLYTIM